MPPIIAAPAMKWSQSREEPGHKVDVLHISLDKSVPRIVS